MKHPALALFAALPLLFLQQGEEKKSALPEVGKPAPTFRLNNNEAEITSIGGPQRHWTVLAFFPKAMTPG